MPSVGEIVAAARAVIPQTGLTIEAAVTVNLLRGFGLSMAEGADPHLAWTNPGAQS